VLAFGKGGGRKGGKGKAVRRFEMAEWRRRKEGKKKRKRRGKVPAVRHSAIKKSVRKTTRYQITIGRKKGKRGGREPQPRRAFYGGGWEPKKNVEVEASNFDRRGKK